MLSCRVKVIIVVFRTYDRSFRLVYIYEERAAIPECYWAFLDFLSRDLLLVYLLSSIL